MTAFPSPADRYEAFLFDLDGVIYRGDAAVDGAPAAVAALRERGKRVAFLTNNSSRSPEAVAEKLSGMEVPAAPDDIVTSAQATAAMLDGVASAFVVGEEGVKVALREAGILVLDGEPTRADAVVIGWDRDADYDKLRAATVLVRGGARLVATNRDASFPAPDGELWPGAGALVAAVETATGVRAMCAGKPELPLFEAALRRVGTPSALVVGDRVETDVAGADRAGLDAAVVFTGAARPTTLLDHDPIPVVALGSVTGLLDPAPIARVRGVEPEDGPAVAALRDEAALEDPDEGSEVLVAEDGEVLATAAVAVSGPEAYLHSVAVGGKVRGLNLGTLVAAAAARRGAAAGAADVFLVTEDAAGFFARLGFAPIDREALPLWVAERSRACSATAVAMRRSLAPGGAQ